MKTKMVFSSEDKFLIKIYLLKAMTYETNDRGCIRNGLDIATEWSTDL